MQTTWSMLHLRYHKLLAKIRKITALTFGISGLGGLGIVPGPIPLGNLKNMTTLHMGSVPVLDIIGLEPRFQRLNRNRLTTVQETTFTWTQSDLRLTQTWVPHWWWSVYPVDPEVAATPNQSEPIRSNPNLCSGLDAAEVFHQVTGKRNLLNAKSLDIVADENVQVRPTGRPSRVAFHGDLGRKDLIHLGKQISNEVLNEASASRARTFSPTVLGHRGTQKEPSNDEVLQIQTAVVVVLGGAVVIMGPKNFRPFHQNLKLPSQTNDLRLGPRSRHPSVALAVPHSPSWIMVSSHGSPP